MTDARDVKWVESKDVVDATWAQKYNAPPLVTEQQVRSFSDEYCHTRRRYEERLDRLGLVEAEVADRTGVFPHYAMSEDGEGDRTLGLEILHSSMVVKGREWIETTVSFLIENSEAYQVCATTMFEDPTGESLLPHGASFVIRRDLVAVNFDSQAVRELFGWSAGADKGSRGSTIDRSTP